MDTRKLITNHTREFDHFKLVYPVFSRRSGGLSLGINLNPDKICNFDCLYCQVDRKKPLKPEKVDLGLLKTELSRLLNSLFNENFFTHPRFSQLKGEDRILKDISLSGDGEPSQFKNLPGLLQILQETFFDFGLMEKKIPLIMITNGTGFNRPLFKDFLPNFFDLGGELWVKLDAGSNEFFKKVEGTNLNFKILLEKITGVAQNYPITVQSCFMNINGQPPTSRELGYYSQRIKNLVDSGGKIKKVQLYTVARKPKDPSVTPISRDFLNEFAHNLSKTFPFPIHVYI